MDRIPQRKLIQQWSSITVLRLSANNGTKAKFNLHSIVHHKGNLNYGHYKWEIKDTDASIGGATKWYSFNDEIVTSSQVDANSKTWYIMFYEWADSA